MATVRFRGHGEIEVPVGTSIELDVPRVGLMSNYLTVTPRLDPTATQTTTIGCLGSW